MKFWHVLSFLLLTHVSVFAQDTIVWVQTIAYSGNSITKPSILERELVFSANHSYPIENLRARVARSVSNLKNLNLFNYVEPTLTILSDTAFVHFNVVERWYTWPSPIFEFVDPNFNTWYRTRDWTRTNVGVSVVRYNFRGRNEKLRVNFKLGYNKDLHIAYEKPFFDGNRKLGLSLYANFTQNYQVTIGTQENERIFFTDTGGIVRETSGLSARFLYRPATFTKHFFEVGYSAISVSDSLHFEAPEYLGSTKKNFVNFTYSVVYDSRNYNAYTDKGREHKLDVKVPALNHLSTYGINLITLYHSTKVYSPITDRLGSAARIALKKSFFREYPYYFQQGLGYNDYVRGYQYYITDGQDYALFKSSLKFRLFEVDKHFGRFRNNPDFFRAFLRTHLTAFFDAGYVNDKIVEPNGLANSWMHGYGLGLDFLTVYDVVIRLELTRNKLGQNGFFIHFTQSI